MTSIDRCTHENMEPACRLEIDLPTKQALKKILNGAHATAKKYKMLCGFASPLYSVRESHGEYNKKKDE